MERTRNRITVLVAVAIGLLFPGQAQALYSSSEFVSDYPSYKGWAELECSSFNVNAETQYCKKQVVHCIQAPCPAMPIGVYVYRWTSSGWVRTLLPQATRVYAWPYAARGWHWIWTAATGWAAARESLIMYEKRYQCQYVPGGPACLA